MSPSAPRPATLPKIDAGYVPPGPAERTREKPPYSYATLIAHAIQCSPQHRLTLSEIYSWIEEYYPYFRPEETSWKNSIRHNLSLKHCFMKIARPSEKDRGKGAWWTIDPHCALEMEPSRRKRSQTLSDSGNDSGASNPDICGKMADGAENAEAWGEDRSVGKSESSLHESSDKRASIRKRTKSAPGRPIAAFARSISLDSAASYMDCEQRGNGADGVAGPAAGRSSSGRRASFPHSSSPIRKRHRRTVSMTQPYPPHEPSSAHLGQGDVLADPLDGGPEQLVEMASNSAFDDLDSLERLRLVSLSTPTIAPLSPQSSVATTLSPCETRLLRERSKRAPLSPEPSPPDSYVGPTMFDFGYAPPQWRSADDSLFSASVAGTSDYRRFGVDISEGGEAPFSAELDMLMMTCSNVEGDDTQMHVADLPRGGSLKYSMSELLAAASS